jgi:hypothetical protein
MSAPFSVTDTTVEPPSSPSILLTIPRYRQEIITGIALLLAFIVAMQVVKTLRATAPAQARSLASGSGGSLPASQRDPALAVGSQSTAVAGPNESPEMAARVLRAWMKES